MDCQHDYELSQASDVAARLLALLFLCDRIGGNSAFWGRFAAITNIKMADSLRDIVQWSQLQKRHHTAGIVTVLSNNLAAGTAILSIVRFKISWTLYCRPPEKLGKTPLSVSTEVW